MMRNEKGEEKPIPVSNLEFSSPGKNETGTKLSSSQFSSSGQRTALEEKEEENEEEPSVTKKLLLEKAYDEHYENSRL